MKITPLLRYLHHYNLANSHRLPLHNSGALPPVHELFKRPSYNVLNIPSLLHGYEIWTLKQMDKETKDSRDEIHKRHSRIQFIRPQKT
jgi:hypothetical protein